MKKISLFAATLVGAAVLCVAPISFHQAQDKGLSLSVDKAQAYYGHHRRVHRRAYYYHGGYYPYRYHGHYYHYRYGGHYYNHRRYYHHRYRYW
jgi:hypothetical protein